jgi:hypothetical protein
MIAASKNAPFSSTVFRTGGDENRSGWSANCPQIPRIRLLATSRDSNCVYTAWRNSAGFSKVRIFIIIQFPGLRFLAEWVRCTPSSPRRKSIGATIQFYYWMQPEDIGEVAGHVPCGTVHAEAARGNRPDNGSCHWSSSLNGFIGHARQSACVGS